MTTNLIREFFESSQLAGGNADYVESLYDAWLADASSVPAEWANYFASFKGRESGDVSHAAAIARIEAAQKQRHNGAAAAPMSDEHARKQAGVLRLLTAYRSRGHLAADLDPLGLAEKMPAPDLGLAFHGLSDADLDTEFDTGNYAGSGQRLKLRDLLARLQKTYASTIGAEFMHISNHEQRNWIYSRLEQAAGQSGLDKPGKQRVLDGLTAAEGLERYLHTKYVGQKRFSLEGGDSLIPMLDDVVRAAGDNGIKELVIGMAHRGRLNVLVNILGKPPKTLFDEFEGKFEHPDDPAHSGDVKYHMGFSADVKTPKGGTARGTGVQPVAPGDRQPGGERFGACAPDPPPRHRAHAVDGRADPWRRRIRRSGREHGIVQHVAGPRLQDRRQPAHRDQQPGRLHHVQPAGRPFHHVLHRPGQDGQCAGAAREWRRPGSGDRWSPGSPTSSASSSARTW